MIQKATDVSETLADVQRWLDENTRDILDESDEILNIKYQLIYTIGSQQALDGDSDRWTTIQETLSMIQEKLIELALDEPAAFEVSPKLEGSYREVMYRTIRIIDQKAGEKLLQYIAYDIFNNDESPLRSISPKLRLMKRSIRDLALKFISEKGISLEEQEKLLDACPHLRTQLLVLRGLIADGVMLFALRDKRYRVDYGLHGRRPDYNLAVPYRAKDRPAVKAEFGHPDVVLILTCLTYYYGGLRDEELHTCFNLLFKTNSPDLIYGEWINLAERYVSVPDSLMKLESLNLLDKELAEDKIFPFFRYNKRLIDFYLSELIFPRDAKGFPYKLSTSGWDLAKQKRHNTTGFSGTNDNRHLLPTTIKQLDLPQLAHTDALVINNILRPENNVVIRAERNNKRLDAREMLSMIVGLQPKVQVLLDVGAQILELTNEEVARHWLEEEASAKIRGSVFFGDNDELLVMTRDGKVESFLSSPLSRELDCVLVYLDEAHTRYVHSLKRLLRGTD
ncbi:hypothetical protein ABW19_dt0204428 [Dactylella cylindrospora]|nr:hypothetical protein ABW19_dt0204428 [Dactylella cylindrospora]